jgi:hypothetical protein
MPPKLLAAADREESARTFSVFPLRPLILLRAHAAALRRSPSGYVASLRLALSLGVPGVRGRLLGLSWFVEAITLFRRWRGVASRMCTHT